MEKKYVSIDTIVGKQVIDSNAMRFGNIKEVTFDTSMKSLAFIVTKEGNDITIEANNIATIGDVVLLKPIEQPSTTVLTTPEPSTPPKKLSVKQAKN